MIKRLVRIKGFIQSNRFVIYIILGIVIPEPNKLTNEGRIFKTTCSGIFNSTILKYRMAAVISS